MSYWTPSGRVNTDNWTPEEKQILREWYPVSWQEAVKRLPGRTEAAVKRQARKFGLVVNRVPLTREERNARKKEWERNNRRLVNGEPAWLAEENKTMSQIAEYRKLIKGWV